MVGGEVASRFRIAFTVALLAALVAPSPSQASIPGENGKIAFTYGSDIYSANPDGSGLRNLTNGAFSAQRPEWSPDGRHIAFISIYNSAYHLWVMNADGSDPHDLYPGFYAYGGSFAWAPDGEHMVVADGYDLRIVDLNNGSAVLLSNSNSTRDPSISPEGTKVAYDVYENPGTYVHVVNTDGTGDLRVTQQANEGFPDWSPDGHKILYREEAGPLDAEGLYTMLPDGSGAALIPGTSPSDQSPEWSPDGTRIVVDGRTGIETLAPDGSDRVTVTAGDEPDWQRIPPEPLGYPRPKGATPIDVPLVPAYERCSSGNETHGAPLSYSSCAPPVSSSSYLTVGTPDANGQRAGFVGEVRFQVIPGNPATSANEADVSLTAHMTDVRCKVTNFRACPNGPLSDYSGELQGLVEERITDRDSGALKDTAATVDDFDNGVSYTYGGMYLPYTIPCTATADTSVGSTCSVSTTLNSVLPGVIQEGKRAIWEFAAVKIFDGGSDGSASSEADNTLFADEGVFVP
jgi:hypothetical protein